MDDYKFGVWIWKDVKAKKWRHVIGKILIILLLSLGVKSVISSLVITNSTSTQQSGGVAANSVSSSTISTVTAGAGGTAQVIQTTVASSSQTMSNSPNAIQILGDGNKVNQNTLTTYIWASSSQPYEYVNPPINGGYYATALTFNGSPNTISPPVFCIKVESDTAITSFMALRPSVLLWYINYNEGVYCYESPTASERVSVVFVKKPSTLKAYTVDYSKYPHI